jgi:hypothetical protein
VEPITLVGGSTPGNAASSRELHGVDLIPPDWQAGDQNQIVGNYIGVNPTGTLR